MVSFFGLKLGGAGDKKKKQLPRGMPISAPQQLTTDDIPQQLTPDDIPTPPSFGFAERPGSSASTRSTSKPPKSSPYGSYFGAKSVTSLFKSERPKTPTLRQPPSVPNLGSKWGNGSTPNLAPPMPRINTDVRPGTSSGPASVTKPLDAHLTNSLASPVSATTPKSPLGQYELTLNLPSDGASLFSEDDDILKPPEPLRIRKQASAPNLTASANRDKSAANRPPSPPSSMGSLRSIRTMEAGNLRPLERPTLPYGNDERPSSRQSKKNVPSGLSRVESPSQYEQSAVPTPPPSMPRASEDAGSIRGSIRSGRSVTTRPGDPVIQNVRAKRETMTVSSAKKRSFEMKVEELEKANLETANQPARTLSMQEAAKRGDRPSPLNINPKVPWADRDGLSSAPLNKPSNMLTPTTTRPLRHDLGELRRSASSNSNLNSYRISQSSSHYDDYDEDDDDDEERPQTPDSPMIPVSGPLASPFIPPMRDNESINTANDDNASFSSRRRRQDSVDAAERLKNFRFPGAQPSSSTLPAKPAHYSTADFLNLDDDDEDDDDDYNNNNNSRRPSSPTFEPLHQTISQQSRPQPEELLPPTPILNDKKSSLYIAPLSLKRAQTAPQPPASPSAAATNWPLGPGPPPPTRQQTFPVLEAPPPMPAAQAEFTRSGSPTTGRVRSFSRPWTPSKNDSPPPPLRFETIQRQRDTPTPTSLRGTGTPTNFWREREMERVETPPGGRYTPGPGGNEELGLRSPQVVGDDFGGGFI